MTNLIEKWKEEAARLYEMLHADGPKPERLRAEYSRLKKCIDELQFDENYNRTFDQNERMREWFEHRTEMKTTWLYEQMTYVDFLIQTHNEFIDFLLCDCTMDTFDDDEKTVCWNYDGQKYDSETFFKKFADERFATLKRSACRRKQ